MDLWGLKVYVMASKELHHTIMNSVLKDHKSKYEEVSEVKLWKIARSCSLLSEAKLEVEVKEENKFHFKVGVIKQYIEGNFTEVGKLFP